MSEVEVSEDDDDSRSEDGSRSKGDDKSPIKKVKRLQNRSGRPRNSVHALSTDHLTRSPYQ